MGNPYKLKAHLNNTFTPVAVLDYRDQQVLKLKSVPCVCSTRLSCLHITFCIYVENSIKNYSKWKISLVCLSWSWITANLDIRSFPASSNCLLIYIVLPLKTETFQTTYYLVVPSRRAHFPCCGLLVVRKETKPHRHSQEKSVPLYYMVLSSFAFL